MKLYNVLDVAKLFLSKAPMTPKKLQKLLYYYEAWSLALLDRKAYSDTAFEAWVHGPVSPEVYNEYRTYGWKEIPQQIGELIELEEDANNVFESVWLTYGTLSANELEMMTHDERPWKLAREGLAENEISNKKIDIYDMKTYYKKVFQDNQGE